MDKVAGKDSSGGSAGFQAQHAEHGFAGHLEFDLMGGRDSQVGEGDGGGATSQVLTKPPTLIGAAETPLKEN